jgi:hypothetical protein
MEDHAPKAEPSDPKHSVVRLVLRVGEDFDQKYGRDAQTSHVHSKNTVIRYIVIGKKLGKR